ncbi:hypothetical protein HUJ04_010503 [Dendroctonus ponderosae]|nr:hypothetical protein HUJ04_010502 [Dendroctonus ponderosae]KAH1020916.1 hypothetical protein HUJ04_010503 [Dendroctonus ponderosae]
MSIGHEPMECANAAILQQTAEYIYSLEQEKTRLLSQNCQLKRQVGQHEGGELPPKKRIKTELVVPTISAESADEGLGSMSPEPVKLIAVTVNNSNPSESPSELKMALDRERNLRLLLEDQVRQLEQQLYKHVSVVTVAKKNKKVVQQQQQQQQQQPQIQYVSEESEELNGLQLVAADSLPPVGHTQTVVCSAPASRCSTPEPTIVPVVLAEEERLPSVLKAAIKAEPKVEVERLPSTNNTHEEISSGTIYSLSNTSRQNLETIVEAIRHLEGKAVLTSEQNS